jgi:hypothetical protein
LPQPEPETEAHRAGKLLLAQWLRTALPEAEIRVEDWLPETNQRADVLAILPQSPPRRIAFEFQCANLTAREWRRRHRLYRGSGIEDLWLLGGTRLTLLPSEKRPTLRTTELERALFWDGAPLLFFDSLDGARNAGTLTRFRPDEEAQALRPAGRLTSRPLTELEMPWHLLRWPDASHPNPDFTSPPFASSHSAARETSTPQTYPWLWEWLATRFRVTPQNLSAFFGMPVRDPDVFLCEARVWQAAIYYRFVHHRVGDGWWLVEVERWARAYLPMARPMNAHRLRRALSEYQEMLAAAGMLSLPMGYEKVNARIQADLGTLPNLPDSEETLRLARYRRTRNR